MKIAILVALVLIAYAAECPTFKCGSATGGTDTAPACYNAPTTDNNAALLKECSKKLIPDLFQKT